MSVPLDFFPWGSRVLTPLDLERTPCASPGDLLMPGLVATMIVAYAILLNSYRPFLRTLRRRLCLDSTGMTTDAKICGAVLLPFVLELAANLTLAGLFKSWPDYKHTLSVSDMLTLGFLRPRMEGLVRWHNYMLWATAAAHTESFQRTPELQPFLRRDGAASDPDLPRGLISLAGELLVQCWALVLMAGIVRYGFEHGFYSPRADAVPNGHVFYNGALVFAILGSITLLHQTATVALAVRTFIRNRGASQAAKQAAPAEVDEGAAAVNHGPAPREDAPGSDLQPSSAAGTSTRREPPSWAKIIVGVGGLGLYLLAIGAWLANVAFWSGLAYSSAGRSATRVATAARQAGVVDNPPVYCPPNLFVQGGVWTAFSLAGVLLLTDIE